MKRKILLLLGLILIPNMTFAKSIEENSLQKLTETTKYYKTVTKNDGISNISSNGNNNSTQTYEISKDEYDKADLITNGLNGSGTTETTYKKLTTTIFSNNSKYRYMTELVWKTMPSVRSYDVIAIGHLSNVTYYSSRYFSQYYCKTDGECRTLTTYYPQNYSTGIGATFKVPDGNLSTLKQTLYFDVSKNTAGTINYQAAYGDYAHSTQTVSLSQAQNYSVTTSGIVFNNSVVNYFDNISPAVATWNGSW